ncbi:hypothetical protein SLA2020_277600 [Shorea laevis]
MGIGYTTPEWPVIGRPGVHLMIRSHSGSLRLLRAISIYQSLPARRPRGGSSAFEFCILGGLLSSKVPVTSTLSLPKAFNKRYKYLTEVTCGSQVHHLDFSKTIRKE